MNISLSVKAVVVVVGNCKNNAHIKIYIFSVAIYLTENVV